MGAGLSLAQTECSRWQSGCSCCKQTQPEAASLPSHPGDGSQKPGDRPQSPGLLALSVCLSVCGWYAVEGVSLMLRSAASSLEKLDTNALPLLLMMASRSPWCLQMCSRKRHATPVESTVVTVGMAWMCLDSLSTTTRMALYPLDSGSSPMVSTEITSQWWVGIRFGVSFPTFCIKKDLQWLQTSHPAT